MVVVRHPSILSLNCGAHIRCRMRRSSWKGRSIECTARSAEDPAESRSSWCLASVLACASHAVTCSCLFIPKNILLAIVLEAKLAPCKCSLTRVQMKVSKHFRSCSPATFRSPEIVRSNKAALAAAPDNLNRSP